MGKLMEAASVTILATLLLAIKNPAVKLAKELRYEELTAIMEVAVLALIIGPIVAAYSPMIPWINVYGVYIFFLLVLTLSLVSYGAARILSFTFRTSVSSPQINLIVKSPLSWYTAVKVTMTYAILVALFKALEMVKAPLQVFYILTATGGFVNAAATILG